MLAQEKVDALPLCGNAICHASLRLAVKLPLSPERLHVLCKSGIFPTPPYGLRDLAKHFLRQCKRGAQSGAPFALAEKVGFEPTRRVNGLRDFEPSPVYPSSSLLVTVYSKIRAKSPHFVPFIWKNVRKMIEN